MKYPFHGGCIHSQSGAHGAYTGTGIIEKRNLLKRKHHVTVCMSNFWEGNVLSRLSLCHFVCSRWGVHMTTHGSVHACLLHLRTTMPSWSSPPLPRLPHGPVQTPSPWTCWQEGGWPSTERPSCFSVCSDQ